MDNKTLNEKRLYDLEKLYYFKAKDVKQFISDLIEEMEKYDIWLDTTAIIKELAGEELVNHSPQNNKLKEKLINLFHLSEDTNIKKTGCGKRFIIFNAKDEDYDVNYPTVKVKCGSWYDFAKTIRNLCPECEGGGE